YTCAVILDPDTPVADIPAHVGERLAPFDENLRVPPYLNPIAEDAEYNSVRLFLEICAACARGEPHPFLESPQAFAAYAGLDYHTDHEQIIAGIHTLRWDKDLVYQDGQYFQWTD